MVKQNKAGQEFSGGGREQVIRSSREVRIGLIKEVKLEQGLEEEGLCHSFVWGRVFQAEETAQAKALS